MPLWLSTQPLVLASKSEIRGKLLAAAGLRFEIRPAQIDERAEEAKAGVSDPSAAARMLARVKAEAVSAENPGKLVLGADQTLARGGLRFSKPANRTAAAEQLRALRGRTHELHSALALVRDGVLQFACVDTARLTMRDFSDQFLEDYLDMAGDCSARQRRRLSARRHRRASVRTGRGRLFHHPWIAADAAAAVPAAERLRGRVRRRHVHPRPDRLDRHGKVDHGEILRRGRRAGARCRCRGPSAL